MEERKNRHTIWLTDSAWDTVETHYQKDNCSTKNEYIEKAVRFYAGYQDAEQADAYLPRVLAQVLEGKLGAFGNGWAVCCSSCRWMRRSCQIWWRSISAPMKMA